MRFLIDDAREHGVAAALDAINVLHDKAPVELRVLPAGDRRGVLHGVYADRHRLATDLARLIKDDDDCIASERPPRWAGFYFTLQRLSPSIVPRDALASGAGAINTADVVAFDWLHIDIDRSYALRRLGNATNPERVACLNVAGAIAADLTELGVPRDSIGIVQGANGAAVLLRVCLPAPGGQKLLECVARALAERHRHHGVMLDVHPAGNVAGLFRLPGTPARKHAPMLARPWGVAWLIQQPNRQCIAPVAVLERLARRWRASRPSVEHRSHDRRRGCDHRAPDGVALDVLRRFAAARWGVRREHTSGKAVVLELDACPYQAAQGGAHRSPGKAFLSWFPSGRWEPGCHSPKCAESITWRWMTGVFGHPRGDR